MSKDWIIEVLGDLRGFASTNALPTTAAQLEEAIVVAIAEVSQVEDVRTRTGEDDEEARRRVGAAR